MNNLYVPNSIISSDKESEITLGNILVIKVDNKS